MQFDKPAQPTNFECSYLQNAPEIDLQLQLRVLINLAIVDTVVCKSCCFHRKYKCEYDFWCNQNHFGQSSDLHHQWFHYNTNVLSEQKCVFVKNRGVTVHQ